MTDFRIVVQVDTSQAERGVKRTEQALGKAEGAAASLGNTLKGALTLAGIGFGISQVIKLADTYTELKNKTRIAVGETGDLKGTMNALFGIANRVQGPIEGITTLYQRASIASKDLGANQQQLLTFVEAVGQGLAIQGGPAGAATGALLQLSQALGGGIVRAEEFNSVVEGAFPIAMAAAKGIDEAGGSVSRLRTLINEGKITSQEFFQALLEQAPELERTFKLTQVSIGGAFTVLRNNIIKTFGEFNDASGISAGLANAILLLGNNIEVLIKLGIAAAVTYGTVLAVQGFGEALKAIKALSAAIALNPFGALAVAVLFLVTTFVVFSDKLKLTEGSAASAFDFIAVAFGKLVGLLQDGLDWVIGLFTGFQKTLDDFDFLEFVRACADGIDKVLGFFVGAFNAIKKLWDTLPQVLGEVLIDGFNLTLRLSAKFVNGIIDQLNKIPGVAIDAVEAPQIINAWRGAGANVGAEFKKGLDSVTIAKDFVESTAKDAEERAKIAAARKAAEDAAAAKAAAAAGKDGKGGRDPLTVQKVLDQLRQEAELLHLSAREQEIKNELLAIEDALKRDKAKYTAQDLAEIEAQLRKNQLLRDQAELLDQLRGPMDDLLAKEAALVALYEAGRISAQQYWLEMQNLKQAQLELRIENGEGSFADGMLLAFQKLSAAARNVTKEMSTIFGNFFETLTDGFANSIGRAIVYSEDLGAALKDVARSALAQLISALVKLGIQWIVNKILASTLGKAAATESATLAGTLATAWAPAAYYASVATLGSAAGVGLSALLLGQAGAMAASALSAGTGVGAVAAADGGWINGPGGPRADKVPAMLSDGEFVVNAAAAKRNAGLLESINSGGSIGGASPGYGMVNVYNSFAVSVQTAATDGEATAEAIRRQLVPMVEQVTLKTIQTQQRAGGSLAVTKG